MTKSKIVLVTGGSRGLGKNMALSLAAKGNDVLLTYHSKREEAEAVVAEIEQMGQKSAALQLDGGDATTFGDFFERVGSTLSEKFDSEKFDFIVNNAGIGIYKPFVATAPEDFDTLMNLQLKGPFFLTQHALPFMNDGGGIVNISSGLTRFALPGYAAYSTMKGGIETFTKYLAKELGQRGIRANVVAPGAIETDFGGGVVRDNPKMNEMIASDTALGRAGLPDDIGGVVAFLCSDDARWINAQRIEVSGGQSI